MLHVVLQFLYQRVARLVFPLLAQHHSGFHHHATNFVGHTRDGTFYHGGVRHQGALYLKRAYAVAATLYHIVNASYKPVVAIFIAPSHVARIVDAIVPSFACELVVAIVAFKQTEGLHIAHTHHNLSFLAILARSAIRAQQVDVILRIRLAHRPWLRRHPRHGAQRHAGFGLSEALHQSYACKLIKLIIYGSVQRLARRAAVAQRREVVLRKVFTYHEAIHRGWCTERGNVVLLNLAQQLLGRKLLVVKHKHGGTSKPLSVELAPYGFSPSRVGHGKVYAVFAQVVPEGTCYQMSQGIQKVVSHHFGLATGATGKIHQHGVVVSVYVIGALKGGRLHPFVMPRVETFGHLGAHRD